MNSGKPCFPKRVLTGLLLSKKKKKKPHKLKKKKANLTACRDVPMQSEYFTIILKIFGHEQKLTLHQQQRQIKTRPTIN